MRLIPFLFSLAFAGQCIAQENPYAGAFVPPVRPPIDQVSSSRAVPAIAPMAPVPQSLPERRVDPMLSTHLSVRAIFGPEAILSFGDTNQMNSSPKLIRAAAGSWVRIGENEYYVFVQQDGVVELRFTARDKRPIWTGQIGIPDQAVERQDRQRNGSQQDQQGKFVGQPMPSPSSRSGGSIGSSSPQMGISTGTRQ